MDLGFLTLEIRGKKLVGRETLPKKTEFTKRTKLAVSPEGPQDEMTVGVHPALDVAVSAGEGSLLHVAP